MLEQAGAGQSQFLIQNRMENRIPAGASDIIESMINDEIPK
jgi:hypothetical protein